MKVENAALGTESVSPRATDARCHQPWHPSEADKAGDILVDKAVRKIYICNLMSSPLKSINTNKR